MNLTTGTISDYEQIKAEILRSAKAYYVMGPGWAQESVVLRQAAERLGILDSVRQQQIMLNIWQELFRDGTLVWGYDVDHPAHPFFHFAEWMEHDAEADSELQEAES